MKIKISKLIPDGRITEEFRVHGINGVVRLKGRMNGHSTGVVLSVIGNAMSNQGVKQPLVTHDNQRTQHLVGLFQDVVTRLNFQGLTLVKERNMTFVLYDIERIVDTNDFEPFVSKQMLNRGRRIREI